MDGFLERLQKERDEQKEEWGNEHDDQHFPSDWAGIILRYAGRVGEALEEVECNHEPLAAFANSWDSLASVRRSADKLAAVCYALADTIERATHGDLPRK